MDFKSQKLKAALKKLIKRKGLTYEDLAEQLECSVPTVKRILGPEELTLSRFLQLCQIADVDLAELEAFAGDRDGQEEKFTEEQEAFLARNRSHFAYLMKLFNGHTPRQIADEFQLSQRSTDRYLIALEKHELIRVTGKQKVKPAFKDVPTLGRGALSRLYFEAFISSAMRFFTETIKDSLTAPAAGDSKRSKARFGVQTLKMTKESFDAWAQEQERSHLNLKRIASFEEKTKPPEDLMAVVVLDARSINPSDYPRLKLLENVLGEIPSI